MDFFRQVTPAPSSGNPGGRNVTPTLLLTRPQAQSERFATEARARLGAEVPVVISPVLQIEPTGAAVSLKAIAAVILTSENGARALAEAADVSGLTAYCVGDRTAATADAAGMTAISAGGSADDLVTLIRAEAPQGRLLFAHGAETRGEVRERLTAAGFDIEDVTLYRQLRQPLTPKAQALLASDTPVIAPLFSPRSARILGDAGASASAPLTLIALSQAVAEAWTGPTPARLLVAEKPEAAGILGKLSEAYGTRRA